MGLWTDLCSACKLGLNKLEKALLLNCVTVSISRRALLKRGSGEAEAVFGVSRVAYQVWWNRLRRSHVLMLVLHHLRNLFTSLSLWIAG